MLREIVLLAIGAVFGLGATMAGVAAPLYFPNTPPWAVHWLLWGGLALMLITVADGVALLFLRLSLILGVLMTIGLVFLAATVIGYFSPPTSISSHLSHKAGTSDFRVYFYVAYFGGGMEATYVPTGQPETINNPYLLLLRVDNVGTRASTISLINLTATVRGVTHAAAKLALRGPTKFGTRVISDKNDLFRKTEAIGPGHSMTGAALFIFPDQPPGLLIDETRTMTLTFRDIYDNQYEFPVIFEQKPHKGSDDSAYPGIDYE